MLIFVIVSSICCAGELVLFLVSFFRKRKRRHLERRSLYKLMEERVLSNTLKNHISSETAAAIEYQSAFLLVEFLYTRPFLSCIYALDEPITIGRSKDNKICIRDDLLSRLHCKITAVNQMLYLQDLGTANGTQLKRGWLNRISLLPNQIVEIEDGDLLQVGNYRLRIRLLYGYEAEMQRG